MSTGSDLTYHVDPRLPVGNDLDETDASHPKNIIKNLLQTQNQATADSYYDNKPQRLPPGVKEAFQSYNTFESVMTDPARTKNVFLASAILGLILCLVFVNKASNLYVKIAIVLIMVLCIHYLLSRLENRTV